MAETVALRERYYNEIAPRLKETLKLRNVMEVPRLKKVVINIGVGDYRDNSKFMDQAVRELTAIAGQKPVIANARVSISNFKLREGMPIGCYVTLRGKLMYAFVDKLIALAIPRIRDFRGVSPNAFDGRGNYNLGIAEQIIFPEVNYDKVVKVRGLNVSIITSARNDIEAKALFDEMGMPFRKTLSS